jgi:hypothetical protein
MQRVPEHLAVQRHARGRDREADEARERECDGDDRELDGLRARGARVARKVRDVHRERRVQAERGVERAEPRPRERRAAKLRALAEEACGAGERDARARPGEQREPRGGDDGGLEGEEPADLLRRDEEEGQLHEPVQEVAEHAGRRDPCVRREVVRHVGDRGEDGLEHLVHALGAGVGLDVVSTEWCRMWRNKTVPAPRTRTWRALLGTRRRRERTSTQTRF